MFLPGNKEEIDRMTGRKKKKKELLLVLKHIIDTKLTSCSESFLSGTTKHEYEINYTSQNRLFNLPHNKSEEHEWKCKHCNALLKVKIDSQTKTFRKRIIALIVTFLIGIVAGFYLIRANTTSTIGILILGVLPMMWMMTKFIITNPKLLYDIIWIEKDSEIKHEIEAY
jgi:hypothetical protein